MLCTDKDLCYVCGGSGHFSNQCTVLRKSPTPPLTTIKEINGVNVYRHGLVSIESKIVNLKKL